MKVTKYKYLNMKVTRNSQPKNEYIGDLLFF